MPRFLLATDSGSVPATAKDKLTKYLRGKGWGVWPWFDDVWFVVGVPEGVTADALSEELADAVKALRGNSFLVMSLEGAAPYTGWAQKEAWEWMAKNWGPPDPPDRGR